MNNLFETEPSQGAADTEPVFQCRVIGIPTTQGSTRAFTPKGWKRPIITTDNKKLKPWRNTMSCNFLEVLEKIGKPAPLFDGACEVQIEIIIPRLKTMPKTSKGAYRWPTGKSDLDKHLRAVGDSLKDAQVVTDDGLICSWQAIKRYADIGESPGIAVTVTPINARKAVAA